MTENAKAAGVVALVTRLENPDNLHAAAIADWLVKVMMEGAKMPGFWSGEIIPPKDTAHHDWRLVQRFSTVEQARAWHNLEHRLQLIEEFSTAVASNGFKVSDELAENLPFGDVATAIATHVRAGMEDVYFAWEAKIQCAQAKFPGYNGSYLQPPAPGREGQWSTLLRFDKPESLQKWFESGVRKTLLKEASDLVKETRFEQMSNSFPGWFPADNETGKGPPNWKTSMLVISGLFPVILLEIRFLSPLMTGWNPDVASFLNLVISVVVTSWGSMPRLIKAFKWWLYPSKEKQKQADLKGTLVMMALFAAEIALFWNFIPARP